jgi:hypothetical protein
LASVAVITSAVLVSASPKKVAISTTDTMTARSHLLSTRHGLRAHARASRSVLVLGVNKDAGQPDAHRSILPRSLVNSLLASSLGTCAQVPGGLRGAVGLASLAGS